ncbi:neuropeptide receptor 15 [Lingula anatina]|uniref:Neuropeptide receptor 15 n=1 Tax=Lingula anatina TaxID=7574 RepID=A0A1S3HTJ4_LINAN|nr:neuropeptide receptor 15 [Lingula anatina]|eukprot:XP_013389357.1 neuropeptide receptor 15 [Lingula anatina]
MLEMTDSNCTSAVNWTDDLTVLNNLTAGPRDGPASKEIVVVLSFLWFFIVSVGVTGNFMVIYVVLSNYQMRSSATNLFITNLAIADLLIMLLGVPDIVMFMLNQGWLLDEVLCKLQRGLLVTSLTASILTLLAVCVERYVAIVHPIQAHIVCSRSRVCVAIGVIWTLACAFGVPILLYNQVVGPNPYVKFCRGVYPSLLLKSIFKYAEFGFLFLVPMIAQLVLYTIIGKRLFLNSATLHHKPVSTRDGSEKPNTHVAVKARRGVVKMLIACVIVYFICYSPIQVLLFYNTFASVPFHFTWSFRVFVISMGYINSAVNPILYSIFSQKFRRRLKALVCCLRLLNPRKSTCRPRDQSSRRTSRTSRYSLKTLHTSAEAPVLVTGNV